MVFVFFWRRIIIIRVFDFDFGKTWGYKSFIILINTKINKRLNAVKLRLSFPLKQAFTLKARKFTRALNRGFTVKGLFKAKDCSLMKVP